MDISHLKELKKQSGFTNNQISEIGDYLVRSTRYFPG